MTMTNDPYMTWVINAAINAKNADHPVFSKKV